jgi:protein-L-isoaspartate(D-aspartate) O-methyltransferase
MRRYSPPDPALDAALQRYLDEEAAEAKAAFHLRMRARGVRDVDVLRAFELVSRQTFVPHLYQDLASRDLALPIGCGQTMEEPWLVARMIEALSIRRADRVLEIGAGSGYATTILAQIAGQVVSLERYQSLATAAQTRIAALQIANAIVLCADGLDLPPEVDAFDRILVHGLLVDLPASLMDRLAEDGVLVCARPTSAGQAIMCVTKASEGIVETEICPCRLPPVLPGTSAVL